MSGHADPIRIRLAVASERRELEDLQRRASLAVEKYRAELEAHPDAIDLPLEQLLSGQVLVAELHDKPVGFAAVFGKGPVAELDGLFVEPHHWRSGIGTALVKAASDHAVRKGIGTLTVVANPTARGFYERCGFHYEGEVATRFGLGLRMSR